VNRENDFFMIRFKPLPEDIEQRLTQVSEYLQSHPKVGFAYLFGGLARGCRAPLSDVDIAVWLTTARSAARTKLELLEHLVDVLGTGEIDLVVLNAQENVPLAGEVLRACRVIVDKVPFERHKFESLAMRKYFDFEPRELRILKEKVIGHGR
jgi:predicted nucleotidyltransferase